MQTKKQELLTAGYQGETLDGFLAKLAEADVEILIDVRKKPISRKPGFSKRRLEQALQHCGIGYVHIPELGMPDDLRRQRHDLSDNTPILDEYDSLLPKWKTGVEKVIEIVTERRGCLLCFEADPSQCHRSRLAAYLRELDPALSTVHLSASH